MAAGGMPVSGSGGSVVVVVACASTIAGSARIYSGSSVDGIYPRAGKHRRPRLQHGGVERAGQAIAPGLRVARARRRARRRCRRGPTRPGLAPRSRRLLLAESPPDCLEAIHSIGKHPIREPGGAGPFAHEACPLALEHAFQGEQRAVQGIVAGGQDRQRSNVVAHRPMRDRARQRGRAEGRAAPGRPPS